VGQFYALYQWVAQGGISRLQQLLQATGIKPTAYKQAAEHVQRTAFPDHRPRVWWRRGQNWGLLCSWSQAQTAPGPPLAWVLQQQQQQQGLAYLLVPLAMPAYAAGLTQAVQLAQQEWLSEGHGSWEVFWSEEADPLAQGWAAQGMLFDLQALPVGILNAAAAAAAAAAGTEAGAAPTAQAAAAPAAAAAAAAAVEAAEPAAAGVSMLVLLPPAQQQQQQVMQIQQPPPTPALPSQLYAAAPLQQVLSSQQQQEWQQLQQEIEQLAKQQDVLKRRQQVLLQLGPQSLPGPVMPPPTPSSLSEPLMPASETAEHPLVQAQLLAQTSDASTLMDQHQLQQPQKRQKLQQQQGEADQGAAEEGQLDDVVLAAVADAVAGPAASEETVIELPGVGAVVIDDRALSLDRLPSLETLLAGGDFANW
jgi:hypothetical protein